MSLWVKSRNVVLPLRISNQEIEWFRRLQRTAEFAFIADVISLHDVYVQSVLALSVKMVLVCMVDRLNSFECQWLLQL